MNVNPNSFSVVQPIPAEKCDDFAKDVLIGLSRPQKRIPCKHLYDDTGSMLFTRITELPEYYPTACEMEILLTHRKTLGEIIPENRLNIVELGAGDGQKTRVLVDYFLDRDRSFHYVPIDISQSAVECLSSDFLAAFPDLSITGIVSDYFIGLDWLAEQNHCTNVVLFLGSTIGNLTPEERQMFLSRLQACLNPGDYVLIGYDLKKDVDLVTRAYNDAEGVTAQFNLNLLARMNAELDARFDLEAFEYHSRWNEKAGAIQSFLVSRMDQTVPVGSLDREFSFTSNEPLHTESSYKFTVGGIEDEVRALGFEVVSHFFDHRRYFADSLLRIH